MSLLTNQSLLVSIRPHFANQIFQGTKRVELRRVRPKIKPGEHVFVYVSSPDMELRGSFKVKCVVEATPQKLWLQVHDVAGLRKKDYDDYFAGTDTAYAIFIETVSEFDSPLSLSEIRRIIPQFSPPQSYHYFEYETLSNLEESTRS